MMMAKAIKNKYDFVIFFDCGGGFTDDPFYAAADDGRGTIKRERFVSEVKRYVKFIKNGSAGYVIGATDECGDEMREACIAEYLKFEKKASKIDKAILTQRRMCKRYFDMRAFGAQMDGGDYRCRTLQSTVQFGSAKCLDPICKEPARPPYALYRLNGSVSAVLAGKTGFDEIDLELIWRALENMFGNETALRKFIIFKHKSSLGNALPHKLFDIVSAKRKNPKTPAAGYNDYEINISRENVPVGVGVYERK